MRKYDLLSILVYEESVSFIMNQINLKENKDLSIYKIKF